MLPSDLQIEEYVTDASASPFGDWFDGLDPATAARVTVALTRIARGAVSNVKGVGDGVFEYRIDAGPGYRIYFGRDGGRLVILVGGGTKRRRDKRYRGRQGPVGELQGAQGRVEERRDVMALTRSFKDTVQARVARDPAFKQALLSEGVNALLDGDIATGKAVLRDYINATVGFESLSSATGTPAKSLMRMFSPRGNPNASNLFAVIGCLRRESGESASATAPGFVPDLKADAAGSAEAKV